MPNPKTGESRLVPDTRQESIETITETYTPESGEEQTATYKIFPVDTIIGGILDKLAFFRTHAAAVWYNKLAGRTVKDEIEDLNANMQDVKMPGYIRIGRLVIITVSITTTNSIAPNGVIFPDGSFPKPIASYIPISCSNVTNGIVLNPLLTNTGSIISNMAIEANKRLMISGSYIAVD